MKQTILLFVLTLGLVLCAPAAWAENPAAVYDTGFGKLLISPTGMSKIEFADGAVWSSGGQPVFSIKTEKNTLVPRTVTQNGNRLDILFDDNTLAVFETRTEKGFILFELKQFEPKTVPLSMNIMMLPTVKGASYASMINKAFFEGKTLTIMTASPNVRPLPLWFLGRKMDCKGCSHKFEQTTTAKVGKFAARFTATCDDKAGGWSLQGRSFIGLKDLSGQKKFRIWVHGDGNGQALKLQFNDSKGGYRDDYIIIDFKGWKQVELTKPALNTLDYSHVTVMNLYYNGLPAGKTVECLIDQIEVVRDVQGKEQTEVLEDFEAINSDFWDDNSLTIGLESLARHGITPIKFGVLCCDEKDWTSVVPEFQVAANIPSPRLGGKWNKVSPWIKESYFFLTGFREEQFDEALAIAKRGNFKMILLLDTWAKTHGHYEINRNCYPDGFDSLKRTFDRFNAEGIKVGLHFLAASIYVPDPYLTPVPDKRLVKGDRVTLATDLNEKSDFIETVEPPKTFPNDEKNTYMSTGRTLWIDDELIYYDSVSLEKPFGFKGCKRGFIQTKAVSHAKGTPVDHLERAYGYYKYDLESTLAGEIADNFAKTGNKLNLAMVYFDGSEWLQKQSEANDFWYYNAILHKNFYDRLKNKNILYQASATSPYSWHMMARTASADGHDDLKAYLEERGGGFGTYYQDNCLPLDIGWYYAYDKMATLDMYEYVLCASIAYDSSMSLQVSVDAAKAHPFTGEILDMIRKYDELRVSGRVPKELRKYMQMNPKLAGVKTEEERNALLDLRRDFRFVQKNGKEGFQRVVYDLWQKVDSASAQSFEWEIEVKNGPSKIGFQVQALKPTAEQAKNTQVGSVVNPRIEINGKTLQLPMTLASLQYGYYWPGESIAQYGLPLPQGKYFEQKGETIILPQGKYKVRFVADSAGLPIRVRTTQTPEEFHSLP